MFQILFSNLKIVHLLKTLLLKEDFSQMKIKHFCTAKTAPSNKILECEVESSLIKETRDLFLKILF